MLPTNSDLGWQQLTVTGIVCLLRQRNKHASDTYQLRTVKTVKMMLLSLARQLMNMGLLHPTCESNCCASWKARVVR